MTEDSWQVEESNLNGEISFDPLKNQDDCSDIDQLNQDCTKQLPSLESRRRSPIWNYFEVLESDIRRAACDLCGKFFSLGSDKPKFQTTSTLKNHLKTKHQNDYSKFLQDSNNRKDKKCAKVSRTMIKSALSSNKRQNHVLESYHENMQELPQNTEILDFKSETSLKVGDNPLIFSDNPWLVESIDAFYYLKCPECSFDTADQDFFEIHATENHPLSFIFFGQIGKEAEFDSNDFVKNESLNEAMTIKDEPFFEDHEVGDDISRKLSSTDPMPSLFDDPLNMTVAIPVLEDNQLLSFNVEASQGSIEGQPLSKSTRKGQIWNYFKVLEIDKRRAKCNICRGDYSLGSDNPKFQSTGNLKNHLISKHGIDCSNILRDCTKVKSLSNSIHKGPIWKYFRVLETDKCRAACIICGDDYSLGSDIPKYQTSTSIRKHLESKHKDEFLKFLKESNENKKDSKKGHSSSKSTRKGLIWNYFKKIESDTSRAICNFCGDDYSMGSDKPSLQTSTNLKNHLKSKHENEYLKFLKDTDERNGIKSEEKDTLYYCTMCSARFSEKLSLNHHIETIHDIKKYNCSICNESFSKKGMVRKHLESDHKGEKPLQCTICDSGFLFNHELKKHYSSVHAGKKLKCSICTKSFAVPQQLKRHFESVHEGMKRFMCCTCGKGFYDNKDLQKHVLCVHEGTKSFKCPDCDQCFALQVLRNN